MTENNRFKQTYCNPLPIPHCPRGVDFPGCMDFTGEPPEDYRSISDPSVLYYEGKWYLYPSYGIVYVSEDFIHWEYVPTTPDTVGYSPAIVHRNGIFYLMGHSSPVVYSSSSPTGPFTPIGNLTDRNGTEFSVADPALFCDDDGEMYLYWFGIVEENGEQITRTLGARLDRDKPNLLATEPVEINRFHPEHTWECTGQRNQNARYGWIEGQWLIKKNGRYYLIYSGSGTQYASYAMGVYYSDKGPLEGFIYQPNNPLTSSGRGLVSGGGHGCVVEGPGDSLWAFYTIPVSYSHCFERRIGMDPVYLDENGFMYCQKVTDTPQFGPGTPQTLAGEPDTGLLPLTFAERACHRGSSWTEGHKPLYALDESMLTWWQPAPEDKEPSLLIFFEYAIFTVEAMRIIWREVGLDYENGVLPAPFRYKLEGSLYPDRDFFLLLDETENSIEENIAYRTFPPRNVRYLRFTITGWGEGLQPGVISFTAFGRHSYLTRGETGV
ncbi:MAG: hypothetical protein E7631_11170 [Ruminococcaceae bacterium]|nr:hypothetical protein [Oscillospiraceae bacterium]